MRKCLYAALISLFVLGLASCAGEDEGKQDVVDQGAALSFVECQQGIADCILAGGTFETCRVEFEVCLIDKLPQDTDLPGEMEVCTNQVKDCMGQGGTLDECRVGFEECLITETTKIAGELKGCAEEVQKCMTNGGTLDECRVVLENCIFEQIPEDLPIPDLPGNTEECFDTVRDCVLGGGDFDGCKDAFAECVLDEIAAIDPAGDLGIVDDLAGAAGVEDLTAKAIEIAQMCAPGILQCMVNGGSLEDCGEVFSECVFDQVSQMEDLGELGDIGEIEDMDDLDGVFLDLIDNAQSCAQPMVECIIGGQTIVQCLKDFAECAVPQ